MEGHGQLDVHAREGARSSGIAMGIIGKAGGMARPFTKLASTIQDAARTDREKVESQTA